VFLILRWVLPEDAGILGSTLGIFLGNALIFAALAAALVWTRGLIRRRR
jgi:hypothetical protein